jgi:hypothetical protein
VSTDRGSRPAPGPAGAAAPGSAPGGAGAPAATGTPPAWAETGLRVGGTLVGVAIAALTAVYEAFFVPLRWGTVRIPVAVLLAVVVNLLLVWFTREVTGSTRLALVPALAWCAVMIVAAGGRPEGDIVLASNNWVALVLMVVGAVSWGVGALVLITRQPLPPRPPVAGPPPASPNSVPPRR